MTQPRIDKYIHACTVQNSEGYGERYAVEVNHWDIEFGERCKHCREPLATADELIAHIYKELTE